MSEVSTILQFVLPHLGAAVLVLCLVSIVASRFVKSPLVLGAICAAVAVICLIPWGDYSLTHYLRVMTGDLSMTGFIWFGLLLFRRLRGGDILRRPDERLWAVMVSVTALILYPTALGLTYFDLYAYGFYPIILAPALFAVFAFAMWFRWLLPALALAAAFIGFGGSVLESDNLWDYLIDPYVVGYAIFIAITQRHEIHLAKPTREQVEIFASLTIGSFLFFAVFLAQINHDAFRYDYVIEDGFIEWCTVVVLFCAMIVCGRRFLDLKGKRNGLFLTITGLLTFLCLFGAGEEISWGQRIFGIETPDYLKDRNAQGELGLHNLVIIVDGEEVKLNKLIFGTGLAIALSIYLFVATPLYRTRPAVRRFFNAIAAPMPRNYHIAGYLLVLAIVELLIDSSKRGEMTEFAGSIIFALNVIYPYNPEIFDPEKPMPA